MKEDKESFITHDFLFVKFGQVGQAGMFFIILELVYVYYFSGINFNWMAKTFCIMELPFCITVFNELFTVVCLSFKTFQLTR